MKMTWGDIKTLGIGFIIMLGVSVIQNSCTEEAPKPQPAKIVVKKPPKVDDLPVVDDKLLKQIREEIAIMNAYCTPDKRWNYSSDFCKELQNVKTAEDVKTFLAPFMICRSEGKRILTKSCSREDRDSRTLNLLTNAFIESKTVGWQISLKIIQIDDLRLKLHGKKKEVISLENQYSRGIQELQEEIKIVAASEKITSLADAQKNGKINYDLALIQRRTGYINKLGEIKARVSEGIYQLEYMERQTADDLPMVQVLTSEDAQKLIAKINEVIAKYLPDASKLAIEIDEKSLPSQEQIWQNIFPDTKQ